MKVIGERISILKKENLLSIVILPGLDSKKLFAMFLWLMAWTVCGIIVFVNYFKITDKDLKMFMLVYLSFWAYFEISIVRAFMWKRWGKEKIWIQDGVFNYQREINKRGKIRNFNLNLITQVDTVELKSTRFTDTISQSFWIKGGERLEFTCQGKIIRFGMQLTDEEAKTLRKEINHMLA
jgi:hypothetical protein